MQTELRDDPGGVGVRQSALSHLLPLIHPHFYTLGFQEGWINGFQDEFLVFAWLIHERFLNVG